MFQMFEIEQFCVSTSVPRAPNRIIAPTTQLIRFFNPRNEIRPGNTCNEEALIFCLH